MCFEKVGLWLLKMWYICYTSNTGSIYEYLKLPKEKVCEHFKWFYIIIHFWFCQISFLRCGFSHFPVLTSLNLKNVLQMCHHLFCVLILHGIQLSWDFYLTLCLLCISLLIEVVLCLCESISQPVCMWVPWFGVSSWDSQGEFIFSVDHTF